MTTADPLAQLLVRDGVLPSARVEEAQERMVLLGGKLDTSLLELGLLDEARLLPLLGRAYNAPAVGRSEFLRVGKSMTQVFPRRLSEKHGVVPLEVSGRRLSVALCGPPDLALMDEIGFMLSVYVKPTVTLEARLAWARHRLYGVEVPARLKALLHQLGESDVNMKPNESWTAGSPAQKSNRAIAPKLEPGSVPTEKPKDERTARELPDVSGWTVASHAGLPRAAESPSAPAPAAAASGGSLGAAAEARAARGDGHKSAEERRRSERVLWTVDDAIAELALADERDQMLDVVLRFAYRRLSTVAIFILHNSAGKAKKSELIGWDLIDPLLGKNDIGAFPIPAQGDHALAQVVQMQSPFLGPLKEGDPLARLFGRRPRAAVLVPILVGDRLAGVLYGDAGAKSVPPSSLAELHMVVPRLGKGLRNLILRKKKAVRAHIPDAPPDVVVGTPVEAPDTRQDEREAREEREEPIEVSPVVRTLRPTIEIDVVDIEEARALMGGVGLEAPQGLSADAAPAPRPMPWADGAPDDEDVRLDDSAFAALTDAPQKITQRMRLEVPMLDEALPADLGQHATEAPSVAAVAERVFAWADGGSDDEDVRIDAAALAQAAPPREAARIDLKAFAEISIPEGDPILDSETSLPDGAAVMPPPDASATADSPGATARESLLLATWHDWLRHEDDTLDQLVGELQLTTDGSRAEKQGLSQLTSHGARAMPSLARWFPGALTAHPFGAMERRPDVEELSDCTACLVKLGADLAAPILVGELTHEDRLHRWTAVWCLSRLRVPGAVMRLAERVFDPEPAIGALAIEVLDGYKAAEHFARVLSQLRDLVRRGSAFERERAIGAVAELRDRGALPALADLIGTKPKELADAARRALIEITKQDFGVAERRWRAWIADNERTPRTRWLIEGLSHKDEEIRRGAQDELVRLTGQYFGYRFDASRGEREQSLNQWQDWWSAQEREAPGRWP